jgi:hypothetical protein
MRKSLMILLLSCMGAATVRAGDSTIQVAPGEAIPAKIISTSHLEPFHRDSPAILPMVVVSFQTQATEKQGGMDYALEGVTTARMQQIADDAQAAIENELKGAGWEILPAEKAAESENYKSWVKSPDANGDEVKREFFSAGKGVNTLSSKEMERVFVGGSRPLVGNGIVLGGWTAAGALCKTGKDLGAKVILFRAIVNFANIKAGVRGFFGGQEWKGRCTLEISYAEMDVYPPSSSGSTPARLNTDSPVTVPSDFVKDVVKASGGRRTVVADPDRYAKDTVDAIRSVAKGFAALSK